MLMNKKCTSRLKQTFLAMLVTACGATAQSTGSFDVTVTIQGSARTLSCYVPPTYNSAVPHRLVVGLHGSGDVSANYRSAMINTLQFQNYLTNTIFIFPDGGSDQARDFYTPAGDEAIIDSAIQYAFNNYNIDTSRMLLQGFSLGGRSALKYGLDNPYRFSGLLLNTPALQGVRDAIYNPWFNYVAAAGLPIVIYSWCGRCFIYRAG